MMHLVRTVLHKIAAQREKRQCEAQRRATDAKIAELEALIADLKRREAVERERSEMRRSAWTDTDFRDLTSILRSGGTHAANKRAYQPPACARSTAAEFGFFRINRAPVIDQRENIAVARPDPDADKAETFALLDPEGHRSLADADRHETLARNSGGTAAACDFILNQMQAPLAAWRQRRISR